VSGWRVAGRELASVVAGRARRRAPARGRQGRRAVAAALAGARTVRGQAGARVREQLAGGRRRQTDAVAGRAPGKASARG